MYELVCADVLTWAAEYDGEPFHAILTDCPYELGFMNKEFDKTGVSFRPETWAALAQHLHPGGFIMAFASSRGWHRLACAIEDAGLRIHPSIFGWAQGSGFPKATRIDTQVDKRKGYHSGFERELCGYLREARNAKGLTNKHIADTFGFDPRMAAHWCAEETDSQPAIPRLEYWPKLKELLELDDTYDDAIEAHEREVVGEQTKARKTDSGIPLPTNGETEYQTWDLTTPATDLARAWEGHRYGLQALKPALEPIIVAQKPYEGKPVDSITRTGAGAYWVDGGRVRTGESTPNTNESEERESRPPARWPGNFYLQHTPQCVRVGERRVRGHRHGKSVTSWSKGLGTTGHEGWQREAHANYKEADPNQTCYADADGLETVAEYECHESCPIRKLDEGQRFDKPVLSQNTKALRSRFYPNPDWAAEIEEQLAAADPVRYVAKAGKSERSSGLDSYLTVKYTIGQEVTDLWNVEHTELATSLERVIFEWATTNLSIVVSGGSIMVRCHKASLSIIRTETSKITESRILSLLTRSPTSGSTVGANSSTECGGSLAESAGNLSPSRQNIGTSHQRDILPMGVVAHAIYELLSRISSEDGWQEWRSNHPTHKPIALTRWLATLLLPPKEYAPRRLLVPFAGVGSEMIGALQAGWDYVLGIEMGEEYCEIGRARLKWWIDVF